MNAGFSIRSVVGVSGSVFRVLRQTATLNHGYWPFKQNLSVSQSIQVVLKRLYVNNSEHRTRNTYFNSTIVFVSEKGPAVNRYT